ncbi:MAG: YaaC family protein [Planctomycetota bacterium]|jgi:hypothetical protein
MTKKQKTKLSELETFDISPFEEDPILGEMVHTDICGEYFEYIKHLCIESKYKEMFGLEISGDEYKAFRTFIQQSYEYYLLAIKASFQVAPICYYYSFLNLMKAYLVPEHWRHNREEFASHGLKPKRNPTKKNTVLSDYLKISKGVFSLAVADLMGNPEKYHYMGQELEIKDLLFYLPGIDIEITELYQSTPKYFPAKFKIEVDNSQCDLLVSTITKTAFSETYPLPVEWSPRRLNVNLKTHFQTSNKKGDANWNFSLKKKLTVVDDTIENNNNVIQELKKLISTLAPFWVFYMSPELTLIPYSKKYTFPVELVILCVMYYLSLVVRYKPYELERLKTEDARLLWLYECFLRNSVLTYYQLLCSRLHRRYIHFHL